MTDLMVKIYNKEIDIYSRDITSHYYCQDSPGTRPLDHKKHGSLQKNLSFPYHEKVVPTRNSLARCQTDLQKNHARKTRDNFQARHPQLQLNFFILKLHILYMLQQKHHSFIQQDRLNRFILENKILNLKNKKKHPFENPHLLLRYSTLHCILLVFLQARIDWIIFHPSHIL